MVDWLQTNPDHVYAVPKYRTARCQHYGDIYLARVPSCEDDSGDRQQGVSTAFIPWLQASKSSCLVTKAKYCIWSLCHTNCLSDTWTVPGLHFRGLEFYPHWNPGWKCSIQEDEGISGILPGPVASVQVPRGPQIVFGEMFEEGHWGLGIGAFFSRDG